MAARKETWEEFLAAGYTSCSLRHLIPAFGKCPHSVEQMKAMQPRERLAQIKALGVSGSDLTLLVGAFTVKQAMSSGSTSVGTGTGNYVVSKSANYDSRKETGYVGLVNQGATCYLNSLLQAMFHLSAFRTEVYRIPTEEESDAPNKRIPLALQRLFYNLEFKPQAGNTNGLTAAFGWTDRDAFVQHDVQELLRKLTDNLAEKMKGTPAAGSLERMFSGQMLSYVQCLGVDYTSCRVEDFLDLQLQVKGCRDIYSSFDQYTLVETLDGKNQYCLEREGKKEYTDAKKGVWFKSFPPVLVLHLRRFEYDIELDRMAKVSDPYQFYDEIDLSKYLVPADSPVYAANLKQEQAAADEDGFKRSGSTGSSAGDPKFRLHSVLVHTGGSWGGHYYVYIRPNNGKKWLKFNDEYVTSVTQEDALDRNYGGVYNPTAYMLIYIRNDLANELVYPVPEDQKPHHLKEFFEQEVAAEEEERKKREKEKSEVEIRALTLDDFKASVKANPSKANCDATGAIKNMGSVFRVTKDSTPADVKRELETRLGIPAAEQRLWQFSDYYGIRYPIEPDTRKLQDFHSLNLGYWYPSKLMVYVQRVTGPVEPFNEQKHAVIAAKWYDPHGQEVTLLDFFLVQSASPLGDVFPRIEEIVSVPGPYDIFQENYSHSSTGAYSARSATRLVSEIHTIGYSFPTLYFQPAVASLPEASAYKTVADYYNQLKNKMRIHFLPRDAADAYWKKKQAEKKASGGSSTTETSTTLSSDDEEEDAKKKETPAKDGATTEGTAATEESEAAAAPPAPVVEKPVPEPVTLECLLIFKYSQIQEKLAEHIDLGGKPASHLRFYNHTAHPRPGASRWAEAYRVYNYDAERTLRDIIYYEKEEWYLYWEVLDMPVAQFENYQSTAVEYWDEHVQLVSSHEVLVEKTARVSDLLAKVQPLAGFDPEKVVLLKELSGTIHEIVKPTAALPYSSGSGLLRIEPAPTARGTAKGVAGTVVQVIHFYLEPGYSGNSKTVMAHSHPFLLELVPEDTGKDVRQLIVEKLKHEEGAKDWPLFAIVYNYNVHQEIKDDEAVLQSMRTLQRGYHEVWLGLLHAAPKKKATKASSYWSMPERELKIEGH
eukprot:TRINITY_DN4474_c0_g1_i1.p1 TRINITY_DN4474_c0_g1~~TRINITY_DN4474_c0_g1_i1.p1  ORF type:complete len:1106 (+),score=261.32 TRINITY_DN4474_c0_g1_i1:871-4188(+)